MEVLQDMKSLSHQQEEDTNTASRVKKRKIIQKLIYIVKFTLHLREQLSKHILRLTNHLQRRVFSNWSMKITKTQQLTGYTDLLPKRK